MDFTTKAFLLRYSLFKNEAYKTYKTSISNDQKSEDLINEMNWRKTKSLLDHAYKTVPYYTEKFNELGLHPDDITEEKYFRQVPFLKKQDIVNNYEKLISNKFGKNRIKDITTGGSTGKPLKLGRNKYTVREAQKWRIMNWWGINPEADYASLYRKIPRKKIESYILNFIQWPQEIISLDASGFNENDVNNFICDINRLKPEMIHGYVGAIDSIADYILKNNVKVHKPRVVWVTAAPISAIQESKINKAFSAPVCDQYGCSEVYFIAAECPKKNGLHILNDLRRVEFIDDSGDTADKGNLIVTDLEDFAFPLIRYMNGDKGELINEKCSCGLPHPLMGKISGRISDSLIFSNGVTISGEYLTTIFDEYTNEISQFQIIQDSEDSLQIYLVPYSEKKIDYIINKIESKILSKLDKKVTVKTHIKNSIKHDKGKIRYIINKVSEK